MSLYCRPLLLLFAFVPAVLAAAPPDTPYFRDLGRFWSEVYPDGGETLYCGVPFGPGRDRRVNAEHVYPMSWVTSALRCGTRSQCRRYSEQFNRIEADMHNLFPALRDVNEARGAMAYDELPGERHWRRGCDFEVDTRRRRVEPRPDARGDIARAMFHLAETYDLQIYTRQLRMLKQWHRDDPPDAEEQRRNDAIDSLQGTRNRFIDEPRAADNL